MIRDGARAPAFRTDSNLLRVMAARFVSRSGGEAAFFVGVWGKATYDLNASPKQLAILMGVMGLCALVGSALGGLLVDRFDPKRVLIWGEIFFIPSALVPIFMTTLPSLTVAVAVMEIFMLVEFTAMASFPPFLTKDEKKLGFINARVESAANLAFVAGPALGAVLVTIVSVNAIFVLDALTSAVAVAIILPVTIRSVAKTKAGRAFADAKEGVKVAYSSRHLRLFLAAVTMTWFTFGSFAGLEPIFFREVLEVGPQALGWVNSIFGLGLMLGSLVLARLHSRFFTARTLMVGVMGVGVGAVIYTGTALIPMVVFGAFVLGVVLGILLPMARTMTQWHTPEGMFGRVTATMQMHQHAAELFPLTVIPFLATAYGPQAVLVAAGALLFVLAWLWMPEARRIDALGRPARAEFPEGIVPEDELQHLDAAIDEPISPTI